MTDSVKNLQDIADICSVSVSTVSRVLNHEPGISRDTVRRVMEVVKQYNYLPTKRKRHLSRAQLRLLVVVPDPQATLDNPFFDIGELLQSVNSAFSQEKKTIETVSFSDLPKKDTAAMKSTDGVIFAFGEIEKKTRESLEGSGVPYIFLNRIIEDDNYVSCNHYKGTMRLRGHLAAEGYGRVGYLGCTTIPVNTDRRNGYEVATREATGGIDTSLVREVASVGDVNEKIARYFVDKKCDAVMCFNDNFAIRFVQSLADIGIPVPGGMAVTGFDDSPPRKIFTPSITTISLSTFDMGFFAARWLRDNIQHRETRRIQLEVNGTMIVGESTKRGK